MSVIQTALVALRDEFARLRQVLAERVLAEAVVAGLDRDSDRDAHMNTWREALNVLSAQSTKCAFKFHLALALAPAFSSLSYLISL